MKKYWILAVAALAACNNETLVENAEVVPEKDVAIGFGTGMYNMTRAENSEATTKYALSTYHNTFYVWGYKRVEESDTEHNYITVFNGIDDVVDGAKQSLVTWGTDWTYSPARFWDKSASYYNFYAVAPSQYAWTATDNEGLAIVNANMVDEDDVKFSLAAFTTDGLSLKQNEEKPTPSESSVFATSTSANPDLMISKDIVKHDDYTGNKVNFEFNHILSRLNIAVKANFPQTFGKKDKVVSITSGTTSTDYTVYVYDGDTKEYVTDGTDYFELVEDAGVYSMGTKLDTSTIDSYDVSNWAAVKVDDYTKPLTGVVKITELKVYNLKNEGDFKEAFGTTGLDADKLAAGTDKRWTPSFKDDKQSVVGIEFKNQSTAAAPTNAADAVVTTQTKDYIGGSTTTTATNIVTPNFNFFYQGLVIPQTAKYTECKMNGTDVYDATNKVALSTDTDPFIKISYTIDGEPFVYYYNLAEVFSNVNAQYTKTVNNITYNACKQFGGGTVWENGGKYYAETTPGNFEEMTAYVLFDGAKFYDPKSSNAELFQGTDGQLYDSQDAANNLTAANVVYASATYVMCDATTLAVIPVLRKEVDPSLGECDITFCEGWQNNLWITIKPTTIQFAADVYEWATKTEHDIEVK